MSEWTAWDAYHGFGWLLVNQLLPVAASADAFGVSTVEWHVQVCHPLVDHLPSVWSDFAGWSPVSPHLSATAPNWGPCD